MIAVVGQEHFEHVDHAPMLGICHRFKGGLEGGGRTQIERVCLGVIKRHEVPGNCLCNCVSVGQLRLISERLVSAVLLVFEQSDIGRAFPWGHVSATALMAV